MTIIDKLIKGKRTSINKKLILKILIFIIILVLPTSYLADSTQSQSFVFFCRLDTVSKQVNNCINISWKEIVHQIGVVDYNTLIAKDLSNDKALSIEIIDTNNDKTPEFIALKLEFLKDDPIKTIEISVDKDILSDKNLITHNNCTSNLNATVLIPANLYVKNEKSFSWADTISSSIINTYPDPSKLELYSLGQWSYTNGFFINALCELYTTTKNEKYRNQIPIRRTKQWVMLHLW